MKLSQLLKTTYLILSISILLLPPTCKAGNESRGLYDQDDFFEKVEKERASAKKRYKTKRDMIALLLGLGMIVVIRQASLSQKRQLEPNKKEAHQGIDMRSIWKTDAAKQLVEPPQVKDKLYKNLSEWLLFLAVKENNQEVAKMALEAGVDPNQKDNEGKTALHIAIFENNLNIVRILIENGVDPNQKDKDGRTALQIAAEWGREEICTMLLEKGADPNQKDKDGRTVFQKAAEWGREEICRMLLQKGVDPNQKDKDGRTALQIAAEWGREEICTMLLEKGVDPDEEDKDGKTALQIAIFENNLNIVRILIENGADPQKEDKHGAIPCQIAIEQEEDSIDIVRLLIEKEPSLIQWKNKYRKTLLDIATENKRENIIELLEEKEQKKGNAPKK